MKTMKATAIAPSNIAFTKYWGKREGEENLRLPVNGSISMNLSNMLTTTTVEFNEDFTEDSVILKNEVIGQREKEKVVHHLDRIRLLAKTDSRVRVVTVYNFPIGAGLSSSASGFAALTLAATRAIELKLSQKELSMLARQGSGSACRSIPDGFVEWLDGDSSETSYAVSLFKPDYWDIVDIVVIVNNGRKKVPTTEGMKLAKTSPLFNHRLTNMKNKNILCKKYIEEKKFTAFGELIEAETLEMHSVIMTSNPPLIYWIPETLETMLKVRQWRQEGLEVYFTINTGHNVHLIIEKKNEASLLKKLSNEKYKNIIVNYPAIGARISSEDLF